MEPTGGRLAYLGVLRIGGPDALSFLQGQLSNDVLPVQSGRSVLAACSSAQGRVLAVLRLAAHSSGILALLPRELVGDTLTHLRKYVLRAKVQLEDASDLLGVGGCDTPEYLLRAALPAPPAGHCVQDGDICIAAVPGDAHRAYVIAPSAMLAQRLQWQQVPTPDFERDWRARDVATGLPQVYPATRETFVAQMLNLDRLDGISFSKGCYTGQEIIARTQHLGRIKRRMFKLDMPSGEFAVGDAIRLTDGRVGRLAEVVTLRDRTVALAVLNLDTGVDSDTPAAANGMGAEGGPLIQAVAVLPDYFSPGGG